MKDASAPGAATSPPTRRSALGISPNGRRSWARTAKWLAKRRVTAGLRPDATVVIITQLPAAQATNAT